MLFYIVAWSWAPLMLAAGLLAHANRAEERKLNYWRDHLTIYRHTGLTSTMYVIPVKGQTK
jgi:hypothetical protein